MSSFHHNVFSYFLGAAIKENDRQRQLEHNTTKALLNTLDRSSTVVAAKFLKWLGVPKSSGTKFAQQKPSLGDEVTWHKKHRWLHAIVGSENEVNQSICPQLPVEPEG
ncbi:hypothetical protein U8335_07825 [Roseiconus lacunae]|uniref:hypothetical protein n=1 Tax=Roseiconus lacunae TaxID=2605694 RepID=UPI00308974DF|nr:hypothetical protein U8335_07825 [Stieleria sp. HD01]